MALDFKHASLVEGVRFTAQVGVPNVVQGLFKKRPGVVSTVGRLPADALAYRLVAGLAEKYGPDPFWVRVGGDEALLLTHPDDIHTVLGGSPSPFASDPDAKRKGMTAFQPTALTISRGDLWADRRAFAEAVLQTGSPLHSLAATFAAVAAQEADALVAGGDLSFEAINAAFQRLTRRVVLGTAAADDTALTDQLGELMAAGNKMPGEPAEGYDAFHARLAEYVAAPDADALTGLVAGAPSTDETDVPGQLIHWLFAMGDTLPTNLYRALALLAAHPEALARVREEATAKGAGGTDGSRAVGAGAVEAVAGSAYLAGCILEAMRLWPTTGLFGRVQAEEVRWKNGQKTPAGTQLLIHNLFNHRNRERIPFADRFAPEEWSEGTAGDDWSFNFFSHGPQGCPGAGMSIFLGQAFLGRLLAQATPRITAGASLDAAKPLPYGWDVYTATIALDPIA
ncbi:cytochrome P450 [Nocardioides phosphati]|uniref:Cytochrome P450 n=1 Tax=Nocardioides phosphati TaxID=1867775 RepID=A0ABQ2N8H4_9ACTN|nr:cytochrome P450 [Nocardioides phosphati]GGO88463.1 cytochrome P450 [Nocardioides phosphati]